MAKTIQTGSGSLQDAAANTITTGNAVANHVNEGTERIDSEITNINETLSKGSTAVANALTFKSYADENTPLRATENQDGEWEAKKEVANVKLRQGSFSKKIKKNDVKITNEVITAKDLGENAHRYGNGEWKSDEGGSSKSENIKNRYKLGGGKTDDGAVSGALDQIDISDGRSLLSRMVKIKSFFKVDDSTFLTFIKKVDVFNNASDISTKQEAYIKVIYQGYAWIAAFPNLNDKKANKKRAIINEIISGSISNFAEVELTYLAFEDAYKSFTADSSINILDPSDFDGIDAFNKLRAFLNQRDIWKKQHNSPVKNKMHSDEKKAMKNIEKLGTLEVKASGEFNIIPGVLKISNPTLKLENLGKEITITSGVSLAAGVNFEAAQLKASGEFTIEINNENIWDSLDSDFKIATATLTDGEVIGSFLNQNFKIEGVKYSTQSRDNISADTAVWNGEILTKDGSITFDKPSISHTEGFVFKTAVGTLNEVNFGSFVKLQNIEILVLREGKDQYDITGTSNSFFEADIPGLAEVKLEGDFTLNRDAEKIFNSKIENGNLNVTFLGHIVKLTGVNYSSKESPDKVSADTAVWNGEILSKKSSITIDNPSISNDKGFYFTSATGSLSEISLGNSAKAKNLLIRIEKKGVEYIVKGSGEVDSMIDLDGLTNARFNATVNIVRNPNKEYYYIIKDGDINAQLWSSNIAISKVNTSGYTNEGIVNLINFSATVVDLENSIKPFKFGVFTLQARTIALFNEKDKKGFQLTLDATMGNVFPSPFGDENSLKGRAKIETGITSDPEKTNANFEFVTLHFGGSIKNPLSSISILDGWEGNRMDIGASIMVFPGVFAEFGLFIESLLSFGGNIEIIATKDDNNSVLLHIDAPVAEGKVAAGAYAGVQAGSALLASFALYLEAFGEIDAKLHGEFEKRFSLNEDTPSKKASIDLTLEGDANVIAQLRAVARALLFFKKVWKYELASKNLGHFSYSTIDDKNTGFSENTEKLVDNEPGFNDKALKEGDTINGKNRKKIKEMSIIELINLSTEDRWNKKEKEGIVTNFSNQEKLTVKESSLASTARFNGDNIEGDNIEDKYKANQLSSSQIMNIMGEFPEDVKKEDRNLVDKITPRLDSLQIINARLNNLSVFSEFINNRIDPKQEITKDPDLSTSNKRSAYSKLVNNKLNIAKPFVIHYQDLIKDLNTEITKGNGIKSDLTDGVDLLPFRAKNDKIKTIEEIKNEIFRGTTFFSSAKTIKEGMGRFNTTLDDFNTNKLVTQKTMKANSRIINKKIGKQESEIKNILAKQETKNNISRILKK